MKNIFFKYRPTKQTWQIFLRFVSEFWLPALIALIWTGWSWKHATGHYDPLDKGIVNFFAAGWLFGNWNRIKKQKKTEDGLSDITTNVKQLICNLDESTARLVGSATGGDSFCIVEPNKTNLLDTTAFAALHQGEYPLYDVAFRMVDLTRLATMGPAIMFENQYTFSSLIPKHATLIHLKYRPEEMKINEIRRYNIFFAARNGSFQQFLQMKIVDGKLLHAIRVSRDDEALCEKSDEGYPANPDGTIDWSGH